MIARMLAMNFFSVFFLLTTAAAETPLLLAENGKSAWKILYSAQEEFAAQELSVYLKRICGAEFPIQVYEKTNGPAFVLGVTDEAKAAGAVFANFAPDEWFVRKTGNHIVIAGGKNRGTLYGVYEFLEKIGNCSWVSWDVETVPERKNFTLPADIFLTGKPVFVERTFYDGVTYGNKKYRQDIIEKKRFFHLRNRDSRGLGTSQFDVTNRYYYTHNFHLFVPPGKYFKSHPEYFSMNEQGRRFVGKSLYHGSQLCLSNPDVAKITASVLLEHIRADREKLPKEKWPQVYPVSQLDNTYFICKCRECSRVTEENGNESALIILYLNRVLDLVNAEYPDVKVSTLFYVSTEEAPAKLRPHKNLICQWCDLYTRSDCFRPLTSRFNQTRKKQLDAWSRIAKSELAVWDYHNMRAVAPSRLEVVLDAFAPDLRYFRQKGVRRYFAELEDGTDQYGVPQIFLDLQYYVGQRLLIDPEQDPENLIEHFMNTCYGPAAEPMKQILRLIRDGVRNVPNAMPFQVTARGYQTPEFLRRVLGLLEQALVLAPSGSVSRRYVEQEGLMILASALAEHGLLEGAERQKYTELLKKWAVRRMETYLSPQEKSSCLKRLNEKIRQFDLAQIRIPVPAVFRKVSPDQLRVYAWPHFRQYSERPSEEIVTEDSASPLGKAVIPPKVRDGNYKKYRPCDFGVYDYGTKKALSRNVAVAQDEQYHWYYIGSTEVQPGSFFHAFRWILQVPLSGVWQQADGIRNANQWHFYVSARFTGPVYVKGSSAPDRMYVDYVVLSRQKIQLPKKKEK